MGYSKTKKTIKIYDDNGLLKSVRKVLSKKEECLKEYNDKGKIVHYKFYDREVLVGL